MTIDERLEKLTERHEALTQTVELIARMQLENEITMKELLQVVQSHERRLNEGGL